MESLTGYIATIVVGLIGGYLAQFLQPRSKILCWSPHSFTFDVKQENVILQTNSLTLQNVGRLQAEDVEIIHRQRPDFFELFPSMEYQESTNPNGEHVIKIKSLGPNEWVVLQLLSYKAPAQFGNVRWKHGQAKWVQIQPQRVFPRSVQIAVKALLIIGIGTVIYALLRFGGLIYGLVAKSSF